MSGALLVTQVRKLCRNPMDSVRGSMLGYLGRSRSPGLSGALHFDISYLNNLPIIISYSFTSFMSFVHLHIIC
jgi:hypothetical protein